MKTLRRYDIRNTYYFIACVTFNRQKILLNDTELFWQCWNFTKPLAWVIMPDHFHFILEIKNTSVSDIMHNFKITYSRNYRKVKGPGRVWQNRFWDHIIRNEKDLNTHIDYIHYNPVIHKLESSPFLYKYSSLDEYFKAGYYQTFVGFLPRLRRCRNRDLLGMDAPHPRPLSRAGEGWPKAGVRSIFPLTKEKKTGF